MIIIKYGNQITFNFNVNCYHLSILNSIQVMGKNLIIKLVFDFDTRQI